jgi:hypothetical protein
MHSQSMTKYVANSDQELFQLLDRYFEERRVNPSQAYFYRASVLSSGKYQVCIGTQKESDQFLRKLDSAGSYGTIPRMLEPLLGDLLEGHQRRQERSGSRPAACWYLSQLLRSLPTLLWAALKRISGLEAVFRRIGR